VSRQLDQYLEMRANGQTPAEAALAIGMIRVESELTEKAIAGGHLTLPQRDEEMPKADVTKTDDNPVIELAADTLRGDCRDSLLAWFKAQPKCWSQLSESEQVDLIDAADGYSRELVKEVCRIIASRERPTIIATLTEYREKDGVEAKLKLPSTGEVVAALHEACGRAVLIVTTGYEEFSGESAPAEPDADQRELGIGDEYQEAA
jgi:hypothetical protein